MQNLKTPQGTVKKGISLVGCGIISGTTTTLTDKSYVFGLSIGNGVAIPYLYESVFNTQNPNVTILSPTQFQLKKGFTYKLKFNNVTRYASNSDTLQHRFFDVTNSTWIGGIGYSSSDYYSLAGDLWDRNSHATAIITTLVDTIIEVRNTCSVNLTEVWGGTFTEVEELESYLIPTDPTKYVETINFTSATGTYTIPSGLPIGTKKLIRKVNSTQGTYTINCTGETFTPSALSSITLNADGDFWLVEKVGSTRWDIVEGKESGSNSNGDYIRFANGQQHCLFNPAVETTASIAVGTEGTRTWTFPKAFIDDPKGTDISGLADQGNTGINTGYFTRYYTLSNTTMTYSIRNLGSVTITRLYNVRLKAEGRWY